MQYISRICVYINQTLNISKHNYVREYANLVEASNLHIMRSRNTYIHEHIV